MGRSVATGILLVLCKLNAILMHMRTSVYCVRADYSRAIALYLFYYFGGGANLIKFVSMFRIG